MEFGQHIFTIISIGLALLAALFTYYNFFREGKHRQRIEFDIDFKNLGLYQSYRIIEIGIIAENKGNVKQKFESIRLRYRGINHESRLTEIKDYEPRLAFNEEDLLKEKRKIELIPKNKNKDNYFFVRPGVKQRFPIVLKIPEKWTIIHVRVTFKYKSRFAFKDSETNKKNKGKKADIHTTERAFKIE